MADDRRTPVKKRLSLLAAIVVFGIVYLLLRRGPSEESTVHLPIAAEKAVRPEENSLSNPFAQKSKLDVSLAPTASGPAPGISEKNTVGGLRFMPAPEDPEEARLQLRAINGKTADAMYARFYEAVGFTAEQRIRFREMWLDRGEEISRLFKASAKRSSTLADGTLGLTLNVITDQVGADYEKALLAEFGAETVQLLKRYDSERVIRNVTSQLQGVLERTTESLTPAQQEKLTGMIAEAAQGSDGSPNFAVIDQNRLLTEAGAFLTPTQMNVLRHVLIPRIERAMEKSARK